MMVKLRFEKKGRISVFIFLLFQSILLTGQYSISQVRLLPPGSIVTAIGVITTGDEFGQIRFMQDFNAGISVYSPLLAETVPGDSIKITGVLSIYRGQLQISPVHSFEILPSSKKIPFPKLIYNLGQPNSAYESMRVKMYCLGVTSCEPEFDSGWYTIFDMRGNASKVIMGQPGIPLTDRTISLTGIWVNVENNFQIWGEKLEIDTFCAILQPAQVSFDLQNVVLTWPGSGSWVEYGIENFNQVIQPEITGQGTSVSFNNLIIGQVYRARLCYKPIFDDTVYSLPTYFSPISDQTESINIFFDRTVDESFSDGSYPTVVGSSAIETDVIARIDLVTSTLDIAMYNTTRETIVQAVQRAVQRGVNVRYIADDETSNSALDGIISFPILYRDGDGIMHNKFIIADADITDQAWLWTGSTNFTGNQLSSDPNHAYVIKDQALALNYRREFDELWGSLPNHSDGKEGDLKTDNTGHHFKIGNTLIESYFSPSDETNCHILNALSTADHHVEIGLLLLTKEDLVDELIRLHSDGIEVRVIVEDEESSSLAISRLKQAGVKIAIHELSSIFHHKYAIIDEGLPGSDPMVITGSHNWTFSADNINDENTLIIHDQSVTNIFRQEFEARWSELVSTSTISFSNNPSFILNPNPASDQIEITNPAAQRCTITLIDVNGNIIGKQKLDPGETIDYTLEQNIPNGMYIVHWSWRDNNAVSRFVIQR